MKRQIFTLLLCALFGTAIMAQAPSAVIKKTTTLPVLDGEIDAVWDDADANNIDVPFQLEVPTLGAPGETYWKALWTDAGIYFLFNVTDDEFYPVYVAGGVNDYDYDKLEIYFDVNADKADGLGAGAGDASGHYQIAPGYVLDENDGRIKTNENASYAYLVTEPNSVGEFFVPMTNFVDKDGFQISQTAEIGFDITVIDRETGDAARKRANWSNAGALGENWSNMDDAGIITLEGAVDNILAEAFSISSAGDATTIETEAGTLQMTAAILPVSASVKTAKWTVVNGTGRAIISADGLLTAVMDGTVTVKGETKDGSFLDDTQEITISNQFISMSDVNEIKNGNFNMVNGDGTATLWGGWGGDANSVLPLVVDGVAVCTPVLAAQNYQYQFSESGLNALPNVDYIFSFNAWADATRTMTVDFEDIPGLAYNRYGISSDPSSNGRSEWTFDITTDPTLYTLHVNFDQIVPTTVQKVQFMLGLAGDVMYLDNITLVQESDLALVGIEVTGVTVNSGGDATTITTDKGTLQMSADILPVNAGFQEIAWSVSNGTGMATIDANGILSAFSNGTVTVIATAKDGSGVSASKIISLSNQIVEILNVDVTGAGFVAGDRVFIAGDAWSWSEPGQDLALEMFDTDGDGIYSIILSLGHQEWQFKFFKAVGWDGGEPVPANRAYTFVGAENLTFKWGIPGTVSVPKNTLAGKVQMYPNPVNDELFITTTANLKSVVISSMLGQVVKSSDFTSRTSTIINTAALSKGMYIVTFIGNDGSQMSQKLMKK